MNLRSSKSKNLKKLEISRMLKANVNKGKTNRGNQQNPRFVVLKNWIKWINLVSWMKKERYIDKIRNNTRVIMQILKIYKNTLFIPISLMWQNFLEKYTLWKLTSEETEVGNHIWKPFRSIYQSWTFGFTSAITLLDNL